MATKSKRASKRGYKKRIQMLAAAEGVPISDYQKNIKAKWRKAITVDLLTIDLKQAFFTPCIYYLFAKGKIVYIGETTSLMSRLSQHIIENVKLFDSMKFVEFNGTTEERKLKEKEEIQRYQPFYNKVHNDWKHCKETNKP